MRLKDLKVYNILFDIITCLTKSQSDKTMEKDKLLQAKCRNLVADYDDILKYIIELEEQKMSKDNTLGNSEFEIIKNSIFNAGIKEGMRKILAKINEISNGE